MPESWTVRGQKGEPSTPVVDIMEGSISRGEPSTLYARIVDGSRSKGRTIHAVCPNRGWFKVKRVNHPRWRLISWTVQYLGANLPRCMPESWTVRGQKAEPSTLEVDIMEGSISRGEPSMLYARIVDGSRSKGRTFHAASRYHGRFIY